MELIVPDTLEGQPGGLADLDVGQEFTVVICRRLEAGVGSLDKECVHQNRFPWAYFGASLH